MRQLKTDRLTLRPFRETDATQVLAYAGDPEWARYISRDVAADGFDDANVRAFVELALPMPGQPTTNFAMEADGNVIGSVHLLLSADANMAELAFLVARTHWGAGIAVEAARTVIDYAFHELRLARVYARADARNRRSIRVLEKLGMRQEALLRSHRVDRVGARCDEVVFGILRDEWESA